MRALGASSCRGGDPLLELGLAGGEAVIVEVADEVVQGGLLHRALHPGQVEEALIPWVHSGVCSAGMAAWKRAARVWLLIMLPLAVPGWTLLLPVMRTVALAALKFSHSSSPSSPPSTV